MYRKALVSCLICISIFNVNINSTDNVQSKIETKKSYNSHEEINGFQWTTGFVNKSVNKDPVGCFYYDVDVYSTDFTNCSKLFLLHTKGEFTSGYIAKQNSSNDNYFDSNYDLWSGYIHSSLIRHTSDGVNCSKYSFDYQVSVKMTNIAWKGYWWEQKKSVDKIFKTYYGTI